jgi:hypothetical protein
MCFIDEYYKTGINLYYVILKTPFVDVIQSSTLFLAVIKERKFRKAN